MLTFKRIDCWIQGLTILAGIILCVSARDILSESFMAGYFLVGGWQLISFITHLFNKAPYSKAARKIYSYLLGLVILAFLIGLANNDLLIGILIGLLILSPFMAIFYLILTIWETNQLTAQAHSARGDSADESTASV